MASAATPRPSLDRHTPNRPRRGQLNWGRVYGAVAAAAVAALIVHALDREPSQQSELFPRAGQSQERAGGLQHLVPQARPAAPRGRRVAVGVTLRTGPTQRQRRTLPDGTVLYVNENTTVKVNADRRVTLEQGEIFLEVASRPRGGKDATFVVHTRNHAVAALGTRFAVRVSKAGTGVVVTQGQVKVSGVPGVVSAGQELLPGADQRRARPAARASHVLSWTRDLMTAGEAPLVPTSKHAGGTLVVRGPSGHEANLSLRRFHIDVHIEDGFARTTIDQTYFNPYSRQREGTFYFPLPPDASLSRLAMYVDGKLREGGMAERQHARRTFETIVASQRDPALLEWVDGSTFKLRVFPLEGRQEKRLILCYTQRLPALYGTTRYRFPSEHSMTHVGAWSFHARVKAGAHLAWASPSHPLTARPAGADLILEASAHNIRPDRDVTLELQDDRRAPAEGRARFATAVQTDRNGKAEARYLLVRYRPRLAGPRRRQRRDWVFLCETSGDRDPLLARTQIEVIRALLAHAEPADTFCLLTAGTRVRVLAERARPVTAENVRAGLAFLENSHLLGALDLGKALERAAGLVQSARNPYLVHVGSGIAVLGERRLHQLAGRLPARVPYVGVGVGKRWARSFMKAAAARTGGFVTQINPDEPISWRVFELMATLNTPRLLDVQVSATAGKATFLNHEASLAQGEELCAVARLPVAGGGLPQAVTVRGTLDGRPFRTQLAVAVPEDAMEAGYLPRTWARLEIDRLLAEGGQQHKKTIIALSKRLHVMSPFTSLLVLENEAMHKQFKIDGGRSDHWAPYDCPRQIKVVREPIALGNNAPRLAQHSAARGKKPPAEEVFKTILIRVPPRFLTVETQWTDAAAAGKQYVTAFQLYSGSFAVPLEEKNRSRSWLRRRLLRMGLNRGLAGVNPGGGIPVEEEAALDDDTEDSDPDDPVDMEDASVDPLTRRLLGGWGGGLGGGIAGIGGLGGGLAGLGGMGGLAGIGGGLGGIGGLGGLNGVGGVGLAGGGGLGGLAGLAGISGLGGGFGRPSSVLSPQPAPEPSRSNQDSRQVASDLDDLAWWLTSGQGARTMLYRRPALAAPSRLFSDLISYAPGLNTLPADVQAVLEAEAEPVPGSASGTIDPAARTLIDCARKADWQAVTLPGGRNRTPFQVVFDGKGRYAYRRLVTLELREYVICDGANLWHLYPELGLGARRAVSRFHRAEFARLVPWALPPAEDLARGADLKCAGQRTVVIIPRGGKAGASPRSYLTFAADGRLVERRVVEMPSRKVLERETYDGLGGVLRSAAGGQGRVERRLALCKATAPNLKPDVKNLVVVPMPLRTREHLDQLPDMSRNYQEINADLAIALMATNSLTGEEEECDIFAERFGPVDDQRLGFFMLRARSIGFSFLFAHPNEPVARYFALEHLLGEGGRRVPILLRDLGGPPTGFVRRVAEFRNLYFRWYDGTINWGDEADYRADTNFILEYLRRCQSPLRAWLLLEVVQKNRRPDAAFFKALAGIYQRLQELPGLAYAARYEQARLLARAGQHAAARRLFRELLVGRVKAGRMPQVDSRFLREFHRGDAGKQEWTDLMDSAASALIAARRRPAVVGLAWQCYELGDEALASRLLAAARAGASGKARRAVALAAVYYLGYTRQYARADDLLGLLLKDGEFAQHSALWDVAAVLAGKRNHLARSAAYLDKALEIEYRDLPKVISLLEVRADHSSLLNQYQQLALATTMLGKELPRGTLDRVVRAADRWRSLDPDPTIACQTAAQVCRALGARDLAWDYYTTPLSRRPKGAKPWLELARTLSQEGEFTLADRAYAQAVAAEPANVTILWERGLFLHQAGKTEQARQVFRRIIDDDWDHVPRWIHNRARKYLSGR